MGEGTMKVQKITTVNESGGVEHRLQYEDSPFEYDTVIVQFDPHESGQFACRVMDGDEVVYGNAFKRRSLSFDPISVIGRGSSDTLEGVTASEIGDDEISDIVNTSFQSLGFTIVPDGEWWINDG